MNVLLITLLNICSINERNIYTDLMREFAKNGHSVYVVSPIERRYGKRTRVYDESIKGSSQIARILNIRTGNIQKTNIIEKGLSTILLERQIKQGIKRYFSDVAFDLVLYSTPPITLCSAVKYIKKRDNAKTYLLLKDIFPQNAVDMGMLSHKGLRGFLYRYFRRKEKKLYSVSDRIGCMSQANVDYVIKHNPEIDPSMVEVCPNSIEVQDMRLSDAEKLAMRDKYGILTDKKMFVYGGNLGRPQGIPFIIDCLRAEKDNEKVFFLIVGDGTEYGKLEAFVEEEKPANVKLMKRLPKEDYDRMVAACDVGLIFLDHRFTIPNFPSRLLSYMQAGLPVLACTDPNTDIGKTITDGGFGWWCESSDTGSFSETIASAMASDCRSFGNTGFRYLKHHYSVEKTRQIIFQDKEAKRTEQVE